MRIGNVKEASGCLWFSSVGSASASSTRRRSAELIGKWRRHQTAVPQRVVSKRKRGGNRRKKAVCRLAKRHRTIERKRLDFHHKTARRLVQQSDLIAVEDLNVRGLQRGMLAKSVSDAGWFKSSSPSAKARRSTRRLARQARRR